MGIPNPFVVERLKHGQLIEMVFSGKFILENNNGAAAMKDLGFPESDIKKFFDPKNEVTYNVVEKNGVFEVISTVSMLPEWNSNIVAKLGEKKDLTKPFPYSFTITKKNDFTLVSTTEMMGKTILAEQVYHNYGMTSKNSVKETGSTWTEIYKKVCPKTSGYFKFESETGLEGLLKAMDITGLDVSNLRAGMAFRFVDRGDKFDMIEYFGGEKKCYTMKYDEESDYVRPEWKVCDKRITTKLGPGVFKTVSRNTKTGKILEFTLTFNDTGVTIESQCGAAKCTEVYTRGVDVEGKWTTVSCIGAEANGAALGMSGDVLAAYVDSKIGETFQIERLMSGAMRMTTNAAWLPTGEMIIKSGERYEMDIVGMGKVCGIGHEGCDQFIQASKMNGKYVSVCDKVSGDFMISTSMVDNCKATTSVAIMVRE